MAKVDVYTVGSKEKGSMSFPVALLGDRDSQALLAQAIHVYRDRKHEGLSQVKTRAEIVRTKSKWFRQKGTGRARHGARSAPIFVGGGVAHGPKGVKRELEMPVKMRRGALKVALTLGLDGGRISAIENIKKIKSSKEASVLLARINPDKKSCTVVLNEGNWEVERFFRNISKVRIVRMKDLNAYDVYYGGFLVFDSEALGKKRKATK